MSIKAKSIDRYYPHKNIEYLDTGSITRGKIEGFQSFDVEHAPSRAKRLVNDNDIIYSTVRPIQRHYGLVKNQNQLVRHRQKTLHYASTTLCRQCWQLMTSL